MTASPEPARWADSAEAPSELVAGIHALRAGAASPEQVAALARRLAPQLATPTLAGSGLAVSSWLKGGALLLSSLLAFYAFSELRPAEPHAVPRTQVQAAPAPKAAPALRPTRPSTTALVEPASQSPPERVAAKARPAEGPSPSTPAAPNPEAELALVQRSQAALDRDPGAALSIAEEHARAYPNGIFAQEREILALEALLKLRRRLAALQRAELFLQRYSESPHSRRVRALLDRSQVVPTTIRERTAHPWKVPLEREGEHEN